MEQLIDVPSHGETQAPAYETAVSRPTGWRKATLAHVKPNQLAATGAGKPITKGRALVALKRVAVHIGLKAADILLIDTLAAFSRPQDWEPNRRAIVWPSNAYLMEQTGFSLSTLKRHARKLADAGVIAFCDSPNGKRWGRRDDSGVIVEAYGFDLSPLATRVDAFEELAKRIAEERSLRKQTRAQITICRRSIRAHIEAAKASGITSDWTDIADQFETLLTQLPGPKAHTKTLSEVLKKFRAIQAMCNGLLSDKHDERHENVASMGVKNDPHIHSTNELSSKSNASQAANYPKTKQSICEPRTILAACPEFKTWAETLGETTASWASLIKATERLRPMIGISEKVWAIAANSMDPTHMATAFALVFEKTQSGDITSPNGYLRGMAAKARAGTLHLNRSVFGRLQMQAA